MTAELKTHAPAVRVYLRNHPEGATLREMMQHVEPLHKTSDHTLRNVLGSMPILRRTLK